MDDQNKKIDELTRRLEEAEKMLGTFRQSQAAPQQSQQQDVATPTPAPFVADTFVKDESVMKRRITESALGQWVLGIIGITAILFGVGFFLKHAFENNWIGEVGRVMIGLLAGVLCIVAGEYIRSRVPKYSYLLSGLGLGLLYLSIFGAFYFYNLVGQGTAFLFMSMITAFGIALAVWLDAVNLAALAAFGGFITPYLLVGETVNDFGFFAYLTVLNLGVLAVSFFKKWHRLVLLAFIFTVLHFGSWFGVYYANEKLFFAVSVLTLFFGIFLFSGVVANIATRAISDDKDLAILTINAVWYFSLVYVIMKPHYEGFLGFFSALLAAVHIVLMYLAFIAHQEDTRLPAILGGLGALFLTVAIPLQFKHPAVITIAWAIESVVLVWTGSILKNANLRSAGAVVFMFACFRLLFFGPRINYAEYIPIFNSTALMWAICVAAAAASWYKLNFSYDFVITKRERSIKAFFGGAVLFLLLWFGTTEISNTFKAKLFRIETAHSERLKQDLNYPKISQYGLNENQRAQFEKIIANYRKQENSLENWRNALTSVFWAFFAIATIGSGILYRNRYMRYFALALFTITIAKVFIIDLATLETIYRIISFIIFGIILLAASYLYFRFEKRLKESETPTQM